MKYITILLLFTVWFSVNTKAQTEMLSKQIETYLQPKHAEVGVGIWCLEDNIQLAVNDTKHYPMQSVYKFHLALALLHEVDKGTLSLNQPYLITKKQLKKNTWSPLRDSFPKGNIKLTLGELIVYSVSKSDNNACDILFEIAGGPKKVEQYIHSIGITNVALNATEAQMHKDHNQQFTNWSTPGAASQLLEKFYRQNILSKSSSTFLLNAMINSSNAANRIKGKLPEGTIVAHKTGSSGSGDDGVTAALNDIGIVTLPNGKHLCIAVFVSNSTENDDTNARIIADITKLAWDYFLP